MYRYTQRIMVHLVIRGGARILYRSLGDVGTEFEVRDTGEHLIADKLFLPKDAGDITVGDVRKIALYGCKKAGSGNGSTNSINRSKIGTEDINVISQELSIGKYSIYYNNGRMSVYFENSLLLSVNEKIQELEKFPANHRFLTSEIKRRLTAFYREQLKQIDLL